MYPYNYYYTNDHEWVSINDDIATIGITEFAQRELGEVVFVELPEVGQVCDLGDEFCTVESVKAVAEVYAPLSGEVIEVNEAVSDDPELINDDPHGEGWLIKLRFTSPDQINGLMKADAYEVYVSSGQE